MPSPSFLLSKEEAVAIAEDMTTAGAKAMVKEFETSKTSRSLDTVREAVVSVKGQVEEQARAAQDWKSWQGRADDRMAGNALGVNTNRDRVDTNREGLKRVEVDISKIAATQEGDGKKLDSLIDKGDYALMGIAGWLIVYILNMALKRNPGG